MSDDNWEDHREMLMRDSDAYRTKWGTWKAAFYAGVLTVSGVLLAISPLIPDSHPSAWYLTRFLALFAICSCTCVLWNMLMFIRLYDLLGFDKIPKKPEGMEAYYDNQVRILEEFAKKAPERKLRDRIVVFMLIGCGVIICVSLYLQN